MRSNPALTDAASIADKITLSLTNSGCDRHDSCWTVSTVLKVDMDDAGWLTRHGRRYVCLTLVEALDAAATWCAFIGTELELRAQLEMQPSLPWSEELMG